MKHNELQEELQEIFKLYTGHKQNWKESHTVIFENLTGNPKFDKDSQDDAEKAFETFIYFCGGAEKQIISASKIIISTKGYYYIGA